MASVRLGAALRQIRGLFEAGTVAGLTDGQLLDLYLTRRDESAFAALVMRHGPMVLGVCHSVLHGSAEVEDAFQATFLVLIRKASTIRGHDAVGGWLYRVAHWVAVQAGRDRSRKDRREHPAGDLPDDIVAGESASDDDWRGTLHEELARLPERLRQPVVLCYLEGRTPRAGRPRAELERGDPAPSPGQRPRPAPLPIDPAWRRGLRRRPGGRDGVSGHGRGPARVAQCRGPRSSRSGWSCGLGRSGRTGREDHPEPARGSGSDRGERRDVAPRDRPPRRPPGPGGSGPGRRSDRVEDAGRVAASGRG